MKMKIQPAVKKETKRVALMTLVGLIGMLIVFGVLHVIFPNYVAFDYRVVLGGVIGSFVAVLNFFLMGLAVQKVAEEENEDNARLRMKSSYTRRMLIQIVWLILALVLPCFQAIAGIVPLLFPSFGIKLLGIVKK